MHTDPLIFAYHNTDYHVNGFQEPIRIGQISSEADAVLKANACTEWAFITAWNPMSEQLGEPENILRNAGLRLRLDKWLITEGAGCARDGNWPPEESFFVAGIPFESAVWLARTYAQRAFVYGRLGEPARLWVFEHGVM